MGICFRFSNVICEMELKCGMWININWGNLQPLTVTGSSELPVFFFCALKLKAAGLSQS